VHLMHVWRAFIAYSTLKLLKHKEDVLVNLKLHNG